MLMYDLLQPLLAYLEHDDAKPFNSTILNTIHGWDLNIAAVIANIWMSNPFTAEMYI